MKKQSKQEGLQTAIRFFKKEKTPKKVNKNQRKYRMPAVNLAQPQKL